MNLNLIILAAVGQHTRAQSLGRPIAHVAYRLGSGGSLYRGELPFDVRGGLMALDAAGFDGTGRPVDFAAAVLQECLRRSFDGVVCLFEEGNASLRAPFVAALDDALNRKKWQLFVPEWDAAAAPHATVYLSSAIAGGSLTGHLQEAQSVFPSVAMLAEKRRECFHLPSPEGRGETLTAEELAEKLSHHPSVHTSSALSTRYFTEYQRKTGPRLVLFDDQATMQDKLRIAEEAGLRHVLIFLEDYL